MKYTNNIIKIYEKVKKKKNTKILSVTTIYIYIQLCVRIKSLRYISLTHVASYNTIHLKDSLHARDVSLLKLYYYFSNHFLSTTCGT